MSFSFDDCAAMSSAKSANDFYARQRQESQTVKKENMVQHNKMSQGNAVRMEQASEQAKHNQNPPQMVQQQGMQQGMQNQGQMPMQGQMFNQMQVQQMMALQAKQFQQMMMQQMAQLQQHQQHQQQQQMPQQQTQVPQQQVPQPKQMAQQQPKQPQMMKQSQQQEQHVPQQKQIQPQIVQQPQVQPQIMQQPQQQVVMINGMPCALTPLPMVGAPGAGINPMMGGNVQHVQQPFQPQSQQPLQQQQTYNKPQFSNNNNVNTPDLSNVDPNDLTPEMLGQVRSPPPAYTCHFCKEAGHWIQFCVKKHLRQQNSMSSSNKPGVKKVDPIVNETCCGKEFKLQSGLDRHRRHHIKCFHDGCEFEAINKVIQEHYIEKHAHKDRARAASKLKMDNALLKHIPKKLHYIHKEAPTIDTKKWLEERRSKFPTRANIERKKKEEAERKARGELLPVEDTGRLKQKNDRQVVKKEGESSSSSSSLSNDNKSINPPTVESMKRQHEDNNDEQKLTSEPPTKKRAHEQKLPQITAYSPTTPTLEPMECSDNNNNNPPPSPLESNTSNSITSTEVAEEEMAVDDENELDLDDDTSPMEVPIVKENSTSNNNDNNTELSKEDENKSPPKKMRLCKFFSRNGKCRNGDRCLYRHEINPNRKKPQKGKKTLSDNNQSTTVQKESLMHKLLTNEIREEKSLLLQGIRYIVQNNFLQPQPQKS
eukprot:TRINITY_DN139_c2_g1_i1.p1 TRINITY_DN139_c2_g1~~TRINITY_DN139_c2_g1_i1.p1  ORF type:complete len:707 (-),score=274.58 TRINITY_DN139_c2_g1_i1:115-2235(-)